MNGIADWLMGGERGLMIQKVMDFRSLQHSLISSNIANAETPNYKAVHVEFNSLLRDAMRRDVTLRMARTDPKHVSGLTPSIEGVKPQYFVESPPMSGNDHNSVDVEREMVRLAENQMMYQVATQLLAGKIRSLNETIGQAAGR